MKTGRPTKYNAEIDYEQKALDYLDEYQDEKDIFHKTRGEKSDTYERTVTVKLPTLEGFAKYIGIHIDTANEWSKIYPEFSGALKIVSTEQKKRLLENGLNGTYNSTIAKLVLSANHGMAERKDVTTNGKELPTPIIDVS